MHKMCNLQHFSITSAVKAYNTFAALTRSLSIPCNVDSPSGSSKDLKGLGRSSPGHCICLAALDVPQGGARKTAQTAGFSNHCSTNSWSSSFVKSKEITLAREPEDLILSTATALEKPHLLKHAVTPAVPQKSSITIAFCDVKL